MAFERLLNSVHETHIVFENLSNINGDKLQKAWGLNFGEGSSPLNRKERREICVAGLYLHVLSDGSDNFDVAVTLDR